MVAQIHPEIIGDCVWDGWELARSNAWVWTWPKGSERIFKANL